MKKKDSIVCGNVGKLRIQYCSSWVEYFAVTRWTHSMGHHIHWCRYWVCGITSVPSDSQGKKVLTSFQGSWSITPIRNPQCYEQEKNATQAHMSLEYCWCIQLLTGTQQVNIINFCMSMQWLCSLLCMFSWGGSHWHSNTILCKRVDPSMMCSLPYLWMAVCGVIWWWASSTFYSK